MDQVSVISGGSSGIGLACALLLAKKGHRLVLVARSLDRLSEAQDLLLRETGSLPSVLCGDVGDADFCKSVVDRVAVQEGRIDWLITSAGIVEPGLFEGAPLESFRRQMETNYFGTLNLVIPTVGVMQRLGGGKITLVASAASFVGVAGYSGYAPSKFAVRALAEVLRVELSPSGIMVSVACPPDTDTPQLTEENRLRPAITRRIASGGGVMKADQVAAKIITQAEAGRFLLTPSLGMSALGALHSLYAPFLRRKQMRLLQRLSDEPD